MWNILEAISTITRQYGATEAQTVKSEVNKGYSRDYIEQMHNLTDEEVEKDLR